MGKFSVEGCADFCKHNGTSMFVVARMDSSYCEGADKCKCYCLTNADSDGTCITSDLDTYDLYKIILY